jgi:hypothetical protein
MARLTDFHRQQKQSNCNSLALTGQTGRHHRSDRRSTCAQYQHSDRSDRWPRLVRPVCNRAQKWLKTTWKPSKCIQKPKTSSNFSLLLTMHESWQMRKISTYSFSNIQNSSQSATHVQMSKLDTLQVRNDLNYMITRFHNHWARLKRIWAILRKFTFSWAKS